MHALNSHKPTQRATVAMTRDRLRDPASPSVPEHPTARTMRRLDMPRLLTRTVASLWLRHSTFLRFAQNFKVKNSIKERHTRHTLTGLPQGRTQRAA